MEDGGIGEMSTELSPHATRRKILTTLYERRSEDMGIPVSILLSKLPQINKRDLHQELIYLEQKGYIRIPDKVMGQEFLNFTFVAITAGGVDLIEDPDAFNKLFAVHVHQHNFGDVANSNVSINSQHVSQMVQVADDETKALLKSLEQALEKKDQKGILKSLKYLGDKSVDLLIAIVAAGLRP